MDPTVAELRETLLRLKAERDPIDPNRIAEVLARVDRLDDRERLEPLLDALRPRLRATGAAAPRQARLGRVLCLPAEPLLVPSASWRAGHLTIPRSVLQPAIECLPAMLGQEYHRVAALLAERTMAEREVVLTAGQALWPPAGRALIMIGDGGALPPLRKAPPMSETLFRKLCRALGEIVSVGPVLAELTLAECGADGFGELAERAMAEAAGLGSPEAIRRVAVICLVVCGRLQLPPSLMSDVLRRARLGDGEEMLAPALATTIEALGMSIEAEFRVIESAPLDLSSRAVALAARLAAAADDKLLARSPERARELRGLVERCEATLREVIERAMTGGCRARLEALAHSGQATDADIAAMERAARSLMELVRAARMLSPRAAWPDSLCQQGAAGLIALGRSLPPGCPANRLGRRDMARIVEILAGPDTAVVLDREEDQ